MRWYGVKSVYRMTSEGEPRHVDDYYDAALDLVEERVVMVSADSVDEALDAAEAEAERYAAECDYRNAYGQNVKRRYLGVLDAYEMPIEPGAGAEIYYRADQTSPARSDADLTETAIPRLADARRRKKFLSAGLGERLFGDKE